MEREEEAPDGQQVAAQQDQCHRDGEGELLLGVLHEDLPDRVDQDVISQLVALGLQVWDKVLNVLVIFTEDEDVANQEDDIDHGVENQDENCHSIDVTDHFV